MNCFTLTRRSNLDAGPVALQLIDDELRVALGAAPSASEWYCGWYDTIGFALAMGRNFEWCREHLDSPRLLPVIDWLDANFTANAWAERGRAK